MADRFIHPGDVAITSMMLSNFDGTVKKDLRGSHESFVVEESIFSLCVAGTITVIDIDGIHDAMPIIGEETLDVSFATFDKTLKFSKTFRVYKMTDFVNISNRESVYRLHFTTAPFIENQKVKVSRSYKNTSVSNIVTDLFSMISATPLAATDETTGIHNIVISNKRPFAAISLMTTYAVSPSNKASYYIFYESATGHKFKEVENLFKQDTKYSYTYNLVDATNNQGDLFNMLLLKGVSSFDQLASIGSGMYTATTKGIDILAKDVKTSTFSYADNFNELTHIQSGAAPVTSEQFVDVLSQNLKYVVSRSSRNESSYFKSKNDEGATYGKNYQDSLPYRTSMMKQLKTIQYSATVYGNTDIEAGDIISVDIPVVSSLNTQKRMRLHSGRFLVASIKHSIKDIRYVQELILLKDSFSTAPTVKV